MLVGGFEGDPTAVERLDGRCKSLESLALFFLGIYKLDK